MEQVLKARYLVYPRKNPFAAVTTLHPPGQRETGWYAANSFLYVVTGAQSTPQQLSPMETTGSVAGSTEAVAGGQHPAGQERQSEVKTATAMLSDGHASAEWSSQRQSDPHACDCGDDDLFLPD